MLIFLMFFRNSSLPKVRPSTSFKKNLSNQLSTKTSTFIHLRTQLTNTENHKNNMQMHKQAQTPILLKIQRLNPSCMVTPVRFNYCILLCIDGSCSQTPMILLAFKTHRVIEFLQSFYCTKSIYCLTF